MTGGAGDDTYVVDDAGDVIVCDRIEGETHLHRLDESALTNWLDDYSLGELWQKNLLGGRPSR